MNDSSQVLPITTDFIVSLGCACRPAQYLRKFKLRFCANPLDWMMAYSLADVINLIQSDFQCFFSEKEELEDWNGPQRKIRDKRNGMIALHSFPRDVDIDIFYNTIFYTTMLNRYKRMLKFISSSKDILFIANRQEQLENIGIFCVNIEQIFDNRQYLHPNITFLNIKNSNKECFIYEQITPKIKILEYCFKDEHPNGTTPQNVDFWLGNPEKWEMLMRQISLTDTFKSHLSERTDIQDDNMCR